MKRTDNTAITILKGLGIGILIIVLLALLVICLPVIGAAMIIAGPPAIVNSLYKKYRTKQFLREHRGKTILFCTDGKFYYKFVERNRKELNAIVDEIIYLDQYVNPDYKEINWQSIINTQGGFPILLNVGNQPESRNLKKEFFQYGRRMVDHYFMQVISTHVNELATNKKVL